ncbi:unnamed protein product [Amoebophrya sp. A120]|nr:unnamed protein product [Amoebophrya sp. A120]|eukprot:GSA120T00015630001.1
MAIEEEQKLLSGTSGGVPAKKATKNKPKALHTCDPRGCLCRTFCPCVAVWAWQGCDSGADVSLSFFCCVCFYALFCWQPLEQQKIFRYEKEKHCCDKCCVCDPRNKSCRNWCSPCALYAWQGMDSCADCFLVFICCCYGCCCWQPRKEQIVWDRVVVGSPKKAAAGRDSGTTSEAFAGAYGDMY